MRPRPRQARLRGVGHPGFVPFLESGAAAIKPHLALDAVVLSLPRSVQRSFCITQ
jgi:hypothetical protein